MSLHTSLYLEDRSGCSNSMCKCLGTDMTLRHTGLRHQKKENCFVFFIFWVKLNSFERASEEEHNTENRFSIRHV